MYRERQQPDEVIYPETINYGVEARDMLDHMTADPPLEISRNGTSLVLRLAASILGIRPAVTTSSVPGGSYSSPVSAAVTLLKWTGSGFSTTGMPNVTAYNCYTNATAIASGKLVWLLRFVGRWFIIAADCG